MTYLICSVIPGLEVASPIYRLYGELYSPNSRPFHRDELDVLGVLPPILVVLGLVEHVETRKLVKYRASLRGTSNMWKASRKLDNLATHVASFKPPLAE